MTTYDEKQTIRIIIFFMILTGFSLLGYESIAYFRAQKASQWPRTQALKIESHTEHCQRMNSNGRPHYYSCYTVRYKYQVGEQTYYGRSLGFGSLYGSVDHQLIKNIESEFSRGETVEVYYHPTSPERSVLLAELTPGGWITLIFGFVLMNAGSIALVVFDKHRKQKRQAEAISQNNERELLEHSISDWKRSRLPKGTL